LTLPLLDQVDDLGDGSIEFSRNRAIDIDGGIKRAR
jgi:hypothetical protein